MFSLLNSLPLLLLASPATFGHVLMGNSTSNSTLSLPSSHPCISGYYSGSDTVTFIAPYTYTQVLSVIGSFRNISWSGSPYSSVTLNGTDNTVGTSRTYNLSGALLIETLTYYSKPSNGPFIEVYNILPVTIPLWTESVSFYSDYDGTTVMPTCNGLASAFNVTINFCATNTTMVSGLLHEQHLASVMNVSTLLGGANYSTCAALTSAYSSSIASVASLMSKTAHGTATATGSGAGAGKTAAAARFAEVGGVLAGVIGVVAAVV